MEAPTAAARVLRFGIFELDAHSGELRRHGLKVRLPDQAFQILRLLLARPGDVITREELRQQLWTSDTFVDFDLGLNSAIHKLREALGDSADNPQFIEDAVAKQPDFAMAYASLGQAQLAFLYAGPLSPREIVPKAEAATRKALELDETLPLAHRTLAQILHNYYWQREDGNKELQRARELEKNSAEFSTMELIESGQFALAIAEAERARRLDPLSFNAAVDVGSAYRAAGQYDRAIAEYRNALEITPRRPRGHFQLGVTFVFMGRLQEAIDELETAVRLSSSGNSRFEAYLAYAYAAAGRRAHARMILTKLQSRARHEYVSSFGIALVHDALGDRKPALAALEQAYNEHAVEFAQAHQYPPFQSLRADPRYQAVMRRFVRNP